MTNKRILRWSVRIVWLGAMFPVMGDPLASWAQKPTVVLNGWELTLDDRTGSVLRMSRRDAGVFLETTVDTASVLDLAYPVPQFEPLRLASRFSCGARVARTGEKVVVRWEKLGASRTFGHVSGHVSATVEWKAASDGKSMVVSCEVENQSDAAVRQILFPDLLGLVPFAGVAKTEFHMGKRMIRPFIELALPTSDQFYAVNATFREFKCCGTESTMAARWVLWGNAQCGFRLFPAQAVRDAEPAVFLQMWERIGKLRLMYNHYVHLANGDKWASGEYWITPCEPVRPQNEQ